MCAANVLRGCFGAQSKHQIDHAAVTAGAVGNAVGIEIRVIYFVADFSDLGIAERLPIRRLGGIVAADTLTEQPVDFGIVLCTWSVERNSQIV